MPDDEYQKRGIRLTQALSGLILQHGCDVGPENGADFDSLLKQPEGKCAGPSHGLQVLKTRLIRGKPVDEPHEIRRILVRSTHHAIPRAVL